MNENYDVRGCVRTIEQRRPGTRALKHLPDHWNFDIEFFPSGQVLQRTTYTGSLDVQRFERFFYDSAGQLTHSVELDAQGTETSSTEFAYDPTGTRLGSITRNSSGVTIRRSIEEYAGDVLVSYVAVRGDGSLIRRSTFEHVGGRLLKSTSVYFDGEGKEAERCISSYDSDRRLVETFGLKPDGTPLGDGRYRYQYDDRGRLLKVLSFNDFASDDTPNHVKRFAYSEDERGNWTERSEYSQFKSESTWRETITTRKLSYYR
jgi:hypothetical protein